MREPETDMATSPDRYGAWPIAIALVIASVLLSYAIGEFGAPDRYVEVKGLAEREVAADLAIWPIGYSLTGANLEELRRALDRADESVIAFLKLNGFSDAEITRSPPRVTDRWLNSYDNQRPAARYVAERTLTLRTAQVESARSAMGDAAELISQGVPLTPNWGSAAEFLFTSLDQIKPGMIADATADARRAANQFAEDSGSRVGAIRTARQGYFTITERDPSSPHIKLVRVVTTIDYDLEGSSRID